MPTKQFLISGGKDDPITDGTAEYASLSGLGNYAWVSVEEGNETLISTAGKLSNFKVGVAVAPGNGNSWTFTIRKAASGAPMADTPLSVTISGTAVLSSLDTDEVVVAAGERVSISATGISVPTAAAAVYWTCQFTPDTDGETILLSGSAGNSLVLAQGSNLICIEVPDNPAFDAQTLFPTAGTLKRFYVELPTAPGNGNSRIFTITLNGTAKSLVVTISGTATTGNDVDPAHNVTIAAGDKVTIVNTATGTPAGSAVKFGIVFLPTTQGEWIASATTDDASSSLYVEYQHLNCGDSTLIDTETEQHGLAQATTAKKIYVNLATAPGAGYSWVFTLREALANTALTVTISNANTSGNAAVDEAVAADALVDTSIDATAGTATSKTQIAILFYNAPTAPPAVGRSHGYIIG